MLFYLGKGRQSKVFGNYFRGVYVGHVALCFFGEGTKLIWEGGGGWAGNLMSRDA